MSGTFDMTYITYPARLTRQRDEAPQAKKFGQRLCLGTGDIAPLLHSMSKENS